MRYDQGCTSRGCGLITTVVLLLVGVGIILWVVATKGASLDTLLRSSQNLIALGSRQVNGPVIALTRGGDGQAPDLFIENWELDTLVPDTNIDDGGTIPIFWSVTHVKNSRRTIRWEMEVGTDESQPEVNLAFDEATIYLSVDDRLQALRQADGQLLWEAVLSDLVQSRCRRCIQLVNGRVVVLSVDQVLQALDAATGETIWQVRLNDDSAPYSRFGVGFAVVGQQVLVIDGLEDAGHTKELRFYSATDGTVIRQLSPTCSVPDSNLSDRELDWRSPILLDESSSSKAWDFGLVCKAGTSLAASRSGKPNCRRIANWSRMFRVVSISTLQVHFSYWAKGHSMCRWPHPLPAAPSFALT